LKFADDTKVFIKIKRYAERQHLQDDLDKLIELIFTKNNK